MKQGDYLVYKGGDKHYDIICKKGKAYEIKKIFLRSPCDFFLPKLNIIIKKHIKIYSRLPFHK